MTNRVAVTAVARHVNPTINHRIVAVNALLREAVSLAVAVLHVHLLWEEVHHVVEAEAVAVAVEDKPLE